MPRSETLTLPAHVDTSVQAIAKLHADHRESATRVQRVIEAVTAKVGRPVFLAIFVGVVAGWIALNVALAEAGRVPFDPPPFAWLEGAVSLAALVMTALILITQRRDDELESRRAQLTLELAILSEQKAAKIIDLLEELRRDSPQTRDRVDREADSMAAAADPGAVLDAIKDRHETLTVEGPRGPASQTRS